MLKKSFPLRVLMVTFLVLALPLLIDSFIYFRIAYDAKIKEAKGDLQQSSVYRASALEELDPVKEGFLSSLALLMNLPEKIKDLPNDKINAILHDVSKMHESFEVYILQPTLQQGRYKIIGAGDPKLVGTEYISFVQVQTAIEEGGGTIFRYIYSQEEGLYVPAVFVLYPLTSDPPAILMLGAPLEKQLTQVLSMETEHREISFALLNFDGIVFAATDPGLLRNYFNPISPLRRKQILDSKYFGNYELPENPLPITRADDSPFFEFMFNNTLQIAYKTDLERMNLSLVAYSPKEVIFGSSVRQFSLIYLIYGILFICGGAVAYFLANYFAHPLKQLSNLMGEVKKGNYAVRFKEEKFGFEINSLGKIFNNTLDALLLNIQREEDERVMKETYLRELKIGRETQKNLLPEQLGTLEGIDLAGAYVPAEEVGGDFYDIIATKPDEEVYFVIADAAGKGVSSCLYALTVRSMLRSYVALTDDLGTILAETNNLFVKDVGDQGMFVTLFMAKYDRKLKQLSYYSFGHVPPLLRKENGMIITLSHTGMAMGLMEAKSIEPEKIQLDKADILLLYSDGVVEATNEKHQHYGYERLKAFLRNRRLGTAKEIATQLEEDLKNFIGNTKQDDDIAFLVIKNL